MVDNDRANPVTGPARKHFYKMSGSGNDFVMVTELSQRANWLREDGMVPRVCDRRRGIGADGVVFLEPSALAAFRMVYLNSDGGRASFCGNAALCCTRLATELGIVRREADFQFETDSGIITGRIHPDGVPEVDLAPVREMETDIPLPLGRGEERAGFALAGVPHAVVLCANADGIDLPDRGPLLRHHPATRGGANVDFISRGSAPGEWRMRTYERGVEGETLACGSGAVASAILALRWAASPIEGAEVRIITSSGLPLIVRLRSDLYGSAVLPSLRGEGRIVFEGTVRDC